MRDHLGIHLGDADARLKFILGCKVRIRLGDADARLKIILGC